MLQSAKVNLLLKENKQTNKPRASLFHVASACTQGAWRAQEWAAMRGSHHSPQALVVGGVLHGGWRAAHLLSSMPHPAHLDAGFLSEQTW